MPSVPMIARKKFPYCLQSYVPGDAFQARDESDAHVLETTRLASRAEVTPSTHDAIVPTKDLTAEETSDLKGAWETAMSDPKADVAIEVLDESDGDGDEVDADPSGTPESPSTDPNQKRRYVRSGKYKRRDLTAEGE